MSFIYDLADTWNSSGNTFTAIKMNVTDTASNVNSLLMDLQVGGASRFRVDKSGRVLAVDGSVEGPAFSFSTDPDTGIWRSGTNEIEIINGSVRNINIGTDIFRVRSGASIGWSSSSTSAGTGYDLLLTRRAAASLRLGAADTSASATITVTIASPGVVTWSNHGLTTGTPVVFSTDGALPTGITAGTTYYVIAVDTNTFQLATSFANALAGTAVNTSGSQSGTHTGRRGAIAQTLGVQDTLSTSSLENIDGADFVIRGSRGIGNKPGGSIVFQVAPAGSSGTAQGTLATALTIGATFITSAVSLTVTGGVSVSTGNAFILGARGRITSPSDGVFTLFNNNQNDFNRLQFGGTTSSFPALKRSTTSLQVRLADDSGDADLSARALTLSNTLTVQNQTIEQKAFVVSYVFGGI